MNEMPRHAPAPVASVAIALKGYPRLSETFIAQEFLGLQERGLAFDIWSLRQPTDGERHLLHRQIDAPVAYLPEYLHDAPMRVLRGLLSALSNPRLAKALKVFARDLLRDRTRSRLRRFGQACVMARELPAHVAHLHVHYLHTPASVVRYAALLRGLTWSFSAHAKDIWTTPDWEKREKLTCASWGVTCTRDGHRELIRLCDDTSKVALIYHGLDLARFPKPPETRPPRAGADPADPVRIVTIGRAVEKKGFDDLLAALHRLPKGLHWHLTHIGGGPMLARLKTAASHLGLSNRISWLGSKTQDIVIASLREADLFVLPSKRAGDGDRDGLPNVIMEAASQGLAIIASDFAGIPEFIRDGIDGVLVTPGDVEDLSLKLGELVSSPLRRQQLGTAAYRRLAEAFSADAGIDAIHQSLLRSIASRAASALQSAQP